MNLMAAKTTAEVAAVTPETTTATRAVVTDRDREFDELFRSMVPAVRRLTWRMLGDEASADDATGETFVRTLVRWDRVRRLPHRDAWVMRVATNVALDMIRKRKRDHRRNDAATAEAAVAPWADVDPALRVDVAAALAALPKRQREVVVLRHLAGRGEDEVADALGVSANTVKTHLARGLAALRLTLDSPLEASDAI